LPALAVAALDLAVKHFVATHAVDLHRRSHAWSLMSAILLVVVTALAVLPSRLAAFAAGVVAGGIAGNLVSALEHGGSVPNPIVVGNVAFTVADVCVLVGVPLLAVALVRVAIVHRDLIDRAIPPRRWERGLRRRLGP
jgi:hypothetical protein